MLTALTAATMCYPLRPSASTLQCIENALLPLSPGAVGCHYPEVTASAAMTALRDKWVVFMGESTLRQLFLQFLGVIRSEPLHQILDQKGELVLEERLSGSRYTFKYLPFYDNLTVHLQDGPPVLSDGRSPDLLILSDGLHDLLYGRDRMDKSWAELSRQIESFKKQYPEVPMMWIPPSQIHDDFLTKHRKDAQWFSNETVHRSVVEQQRGGGGCQFYFDAFRNVSFERDGAFDGVHSMERARKEAEGLIRALYRLSTDPGVWKVDRWTAGQMMAVLVYGVVAAVVLLSESAKFAFFRKKPLTEHAIHCVEELDSLLDTVHSLEHSHGGAESPKAVSEKVSELRSRRECLSATAEEAEYEWMLPQCLEALQPVLEWWMARYVAQQEYWRAMMQFMACLALLFLADGPEHVLVSPSLKHYDRDFFSLVSFLFLHHFKEHSPR